MPTYRKWWFNRDDHAKINFAHLSLTRPAKAIVFKFNGVIEFEGMSCFHAEPPCHVVMPAKINNLASINKDRRVYRSQPLKHSTRRVVPYWAGVGFHKFTEFVLPHLKIFSVINKCSLEMDAAFTLVSVDPRCHLVWLFYLPADVFHQPLLVSSATR